MRRRVARQEPTWSKLVALYKPIALQRRIVDFCPVHAGFLRNVGAAAHSSETHEHTGPPVSVGKPVLGRCSQIPRGVVALAEGNPSSGATPRGSLQVISRLNEASRDNALGHALIWNAVEDQGGGEHRRLRSYPGL